ncbi:MAG: lysophospholipid acyltransferase family protein [Planctomycetota bacterium]
MPKQVMQRTMNVPSRREVVTAAIASGVFNIAYALAAVLVGYPFPVRQSGNATVPKSGGILVVGNHQGFLDPIVIGLTLPRKASYLARASLFKFPPFGWFLRCLNAIRLDRDGVAKEGIRTSLRVLEEGGALVLWPEGTRTYDGSVSELRPGILLLLRRTRVPIVIAGVSGSYESWPRNRLLPFPRPVWIHYSLWRFDKEMGETETLTSLREAIESAMREAEARRLRTFGR